MLDYCAEFSAARQELKDAGAIEDARSRREVAQGVASRLRERVKAMEAVRRRSVANYVFAHSFEELVGVAESLRSAPGGKVIVIINESIKTAAPQQSTEGKK